MGGAKALGPYGLTSIVSLFAFQIFGLAGTAHAADVVPPPAATPAKSNPLRTLTVSAPAGSKVTVSFTLADGTGGGLTVSFPKSVKPNSNEIEKASFTVEGAQGEAAVEKSPQAKTGTPSAEASGNGSGGSANIPQHTTPVPPPSGGGTGGNAPAPKNEGTGGVEGSGGATGTTDIKPAVKNDASQTEQSGKGAQSIFGAGVGLSLSANMGHNRADAVKLVTRSDGSVYAQVQATQDVNIGMLAETHVFFKKQDLYSSFEKFGSDPLAGVGGIGGSLVACGPWAFVRQDYQSGCGPIFVANISGGSGATITQFGLGWGIGIKSAEGKTSDLGVGFGVLIDPSDKVLDTRVINADTKLVDPRYQAGLLNGTISPTVSRATQSFFLMVSKTF